MKLNVNGKDYTSNSETDTPLLWVLRDELKIKGPKFGCGISQCGACTVHKNGKAIRSCSLPLKNANGPIATIENAPNNRILKVVQETWIENQVAQCGYCQPGQIMQASSLLSSTPNPTDEQIDKAMSGNLCRCGTYPRIKAAIKSSIKKLGGA